MPAGSDPRHPEGQLVGLAARAHEVAHIERTRHQVGETSSVLDDVVVQVARVRVEETDLPAGRFDHTGVTVSHVTDVVHAIEVGLSVLVEQELALAAHDVQGSPVRDAERGAEMAPS